MAWLPQVLGEHIFDLPRVPGTTDGPSMMTLFGQEFDLQCTYVFVCANKKLKPTDESFIEKIECRRAGSRVTAWLELDT